MRLGTLGLAALLVTMLCLPTATAQDEADLVLHGTEALDCPPGTLMCFLVEAGSLDGAFVAGEQATVSLVAAGQAPHNVHVTTSDQADPNRIDTEADAAFANSDTIDAGENTTFTFTVPLDAEELYLWCDVGEHEAGGMWVLAEVQPAPEPERSEGNTTEEPPEEGTNSSTEGDQEQPSEEDGSMEGGMDGDMAGSDGEGEENGTPVPVWVPLAAFVVAGIAAGTRPRS